MGSSTHTDDEVVATTPDALRQQALRQLKKRRDLHSHAFVYLMVNLVLWGLWAFFSARSHHWNPWPLWVTLAWGLGLIFNAWDVYVRRAITEQEIEREVDRLQHRSGGRGLGA